MRALLMGLVLICAGCAHENLPIESFGEDAFRFSSAPALGGRGVIVELHRRDAEFAEGAVRFIYVFNDRNESLGSLKLFMGADDYDAFMRDVDALLAIPEPSGMQPNGDLIVCADGPGYLTERRLNGVTTRRDGFCNGDSNNGVARRVNQLLQEAMARHTNAPSE